MTSEQRFWAKVDRREPDDCWLWTGAVGTTGYGRCTFERYTRSAHRIAFQLANGHEPYPFALHSCDVRLCCNPAHLREGDHQANMADKIARGRARNQHGSGWAQRTHCGEGHEFTPENTYLYGQTRQCRACGRERQRRRYYKVKAQQEQAA